MKLRTLIAASILTFSTLGNVALAAEKTPAVETAQASADSQQPININTATEEELTKIKGVGTKKSQAIIAYRKEIGKFKSVEQLLEVDGIGQSILDKNKAFLAVK